MNLKWALANSIKWTLGVKHDLFLIISTDRNCHCFYVNVNCSVIIEPSSNDLLLATDSSSLAILILLDLTAAFNTVSHTILLDRLASIGIMGTPLNWFTSYLAARSQFIKLSSHSSRPSPVTSGVPKVQSLDPYWSSFTFSPLDRSSKNTFLSTTTLTIPNNTSPSHHFLLPSSPSFSTV